MNKVGFFVCFLKSLLAVAAETGTSVMQWGFSLVLLFIFFSSVLFCFAAVFMREVGSPVKLVTARVVTGRVSEGGASRGVRKEEEKKVQ